MINKFNIGDILFYEEGLNYIRILEVTDKKYKIEWLERSITNNLLTTTADRKCSFFYFHEIEEYFELDINYKLLKLLDSI